MCHFKIIICLWQIRFSISVQLEFAAERYKVLQGNAEGYKKEIQALRDKSQKYSTSVAKHEQTINTLRQVKYYSTSVVYLCSSIITHSIHQTCN